MNYKYLVRAGEVTSKTDGQRHCISYKQLIQLYKVTPSECLLWHKAEEWLKGSRRTELQNLIYLVPQTSGNYDTTTCKTF